MARFRFDVGSLTFIGLGISGARGLSLAAVDSIKSSGKAYLETYTSPLREDVKSRIEEISGRSIIPVTREFVEDGREILKAASVGEVVLVTPGDPMVATTHIDLRLRAISAGITTRVVHSSSILSAIPGETGLHPYKFGRIMTVVDNPTSALTLYYCIHDNLLRGLHTILLLQQDDPVRYVDPIRAFNILLSAEESEARKVLSKETSCIVTSRVGYHDQRIVGGKIGDLLGYDFGLPPHSIILPGGLHFTEIEALKGLVEKGAEVADNFCGTKRRAEVMINHYVPKARIALLKAKERSAGDAPKKLEDIFENVDCYLSDSERFLKEGREELAVLSLGYAEGLLDSLRLMGIIEVEW